MFTAGNKMFSPGPNKQQILWLTDIKKKNNLSRIIDQQPAWRDLNTSYLTCHCYQHKIITPEQAAKKEHGIKAITG